VFLAGTDDDADGDGGGGGGSDSREQQTEVQEDLSSDFDSLSGSTTPPAGKPMKAFSASRNNAKM